MIESMLMAKSEFNNDLIVSYSDILFSDEMLKGMMSSKEDFSFAVDDNWKEYWHMRYGNIEFDTESLKISKEGHITSLGLPDVPSNGIDARYVGLLKFSKRGCEIINEIMERGYKEYKDKPWKQSGKTIRQAYMTDLLQAIIENNHKVSAEHFNNGWVEFDTNEDSEKAIEWAKDGGVRKLGLEILLYGMRNYQI